MQLDYPLGLQNPQMHYAWGTKDRLQQLFGIPCENNLPQAELWMGAHAKAPSKVITRDGSVISLDQLIAAYPVAITGNDQGTLPFLFKLLSAEKPLSIQVHPDKKQAAEGFNRENMEGVPIDAAYRNYRDNNHKPELIYALTPFKALCGFRSIKEINHHINLLIEEGITLPHYLTDFRATAEELHLILAWMLNMTETEKTLLIQQVINLAKRKPDNPLFETILGLHAYYPQDSAIIAPFWLNLVNLAPGEALFLNAGCPHAYLYGTGMEVMACSDNVLRGGLTYKHIDVTELCEITDFTPGNISLLTPEETVSDGLTTFSAPVTDFSFSLLDIDQPWHRYAGNVHIVFCMEGEIMISGGGIDYPLTRGKSCLLPAAGAMSINGSGKLALVGDGEKKTACLFHPC